MSMNLIYIRVSTKDQNLNSQKDILVNKYKNTNYKLFEEKASGKTMERPVLLEMLDYARTGDSIICYDLSRLGRTTVGVLELINNLKARGITFISHKENFDTTSPTGVFFLQMMAMLNEMNREVQNEKIRNGLISARSRGRIGGRPPSNKDKIDYALMLYDKQELSVSAICNKVGISHGTLYKYLNSRTKEN